METIDHNREKVRVQQWRLIDDVLDKVPAHLHELIQHKESMTKFMRDLGRFSLQLITHDWQQAWLDEVRFLQVPNQQFLIREVHLRCDEYDFIFARAVIPEATMRGPGEVLKTLRSKSLGEILFEDSHLKRSEYEIKKLLPHELLFKKAIANASDDNLEELWARRSIFHFHNNPLLLMEVFYNPSSLLLDPYD